MRLVALLILCVFLIAGARGTPAMTVTEIPSPAGTRSSGGSLVIAPDGRVWMTWLEPLEATAAETQLRFATFDRDTRQWSPAATIAAGRDWFVNWADFPALTVGRDGAATAVWYVNNPEPAPVPSAAASTGAGADHHGPGYHARISRTHDGGATWSEPVPLTRESGSVEFVSLATLPDGRVLAAWLDGRGRSHGAGAQRLYARIVGSQEPDTLVDPSVCDCCQTSLATFPDGSALLAYRGRSADEIRDIRVARFHHGRWSEPRRVAADDWRIAGCPVNGPQLASDGARVALAWFTAADEQPRVLASFSPDAGARFLMPLRLDATKPLGRVDTLLLRDGAMLASWLGADGAITLRRISPEFSLSTSVALAQPGSARASGFPRLALVRDYAGGKSQAELLAVVAGDSARPGLKTLLVTVPEGELINAESNCDCAPSAEQLLGYPIRGTLRSFDRERDAVRVELPETPGLFARGEHEFLVAPALLAAIAEGPDRPFLGRVELRDSRWWVLDLRLLAVRR